MKILSKGQIILTFSVFLAFVVLEYRRTHFPGLFYLKYKDGKIEILDQKVWTKPCCCFFETLNFLFL